MRPDFLSSQGHGLFPLVVLVLIAIEAGYMIAVAKRGYDLKVTAASIGVALGHLLTRPLTAALIMLVFPWIARLAPWHLPAGNAWVWIGGFFAVEFAYYWMHRFSHTVRWWWASHAVHHSSPVFALPSAIRLGWTSAVSGEWLLFLPLILLGLPPMVVSVLLALNLAYQFFLHTELSPKWGWLEYVLNTPSHHRLHHASNTAWLDRNFGGVLIVFDRLFGTFAADDGREPMRFGLTRPIASHNPFVIAFAEWRRMLNDLRHVRSPQQALDCLFGRPR